MSTKHLFLIARKKIRPSQPLYSPRTYTRYQNPPRTKQSNLLLPPTEVLTPPTSETTSAGLKVYVSLKVLSRKMHSAQGNAGIYRKFIPELNRKSKPSVNIFFLPDAEPGIRNRIQNTTTFGKVLHHISWSNHHPHFNLDYLTANRIMSL